MREELYEGEVYRHTVESAADEAYRIVSPDCDISPRVYAGPKCEPVTRELGKLLLAYGIHARRRYIAGPPTASWMYHYLLRDIDRALFVDPTWQQFLPKPERQPELPRVLIATEAEMRRVCSELDVDENYRAIWDEDPAERLLMR